MGTEEHFIADPHPPPPVQPPIPLPDEQIFLEAEKDEMAVEEFPDHPLPEAPIAPIPELDADVLAAEEGGPAAPEEETQESWAIHGLFDSWLGRVIGVSDSSLHLSEGVCGVIDVVRCDIRWDRQALGGEAKVCNQVTATDKPQAFAEATPIIAHAWPSNDRRDQEGYHVAVGDIVTVVTGKDHRAYYLLDNTPFLGRVVAASGASVQEDNASGAGTRLLTVRRQCLWADPDGGAFLGAETSDAYNYNGAVTYLDYANVLVLIQDGQQAGYRIGDWIWVLKRGRYYFAVASRQSFLAQITNAGPEGEADFIDNRYWAKEVDIAVTYTANTWAIDSTSVRATVHPDGYTGRYGRWIAAKNTGEDDGAAALHQLPVGGSVVVIVNQYADVKSPIAAADPRNPIYFFDHKPDPDPPPGELLWGVAYEATPWSAGATSIMLHPCDDPVGAGVDTGTDVTGHIYSPTGHAPAFCDVSQNDVLCYVNHPAVNPEGILVNPPARWLPTGGSQYYVLQKDSGDTYDVVWEEVRAT